MLDIDRVYGWLHYCVRQEWTDNPQQWGVYTLNNDIGRADNLMLMHPREYAVWNAKYRIGLEV